ncbi:hypothetical protein KJ068_10935 [bacterium]|nr:hypothetical protein [bacterium]
MPNPIREKPNPGSSIHVNAYFSIPLNFPQNLIQRLTNKIRITLCKAHQRFDAQGVAEQAAFAIPNILEIPEA